MEDENEQDLKKQINSIMKEEKETFYELVAAKIYE